MRWKTCSTIRTRSPKCLAVRESPGSPSNCVFHRTQSARSAADTPWLPQYPLYLRHSNGLRSPAFVCASLPFPSLPFPEGNARPVPSEVCPVKCDCTLARMLENTRAFVRRRPDEFKLGRTAVSRTACPRNRTELRLAASDAVRATTTLPSFASAMPDELWRTIMVSRGLWALYGTLGHSRALQVTIGYSRGTLGY
jgi:hypothetical protein